MEKKKFIDAGRIVNTHGVHGEVKIEVWLDSPEYLKSFPRIFLEDGREKKLLAGWVQKQFLIAALEGVADLNTAMTLKGKLVRIAREDAALPEGSYFLQDIIGADVLDEDGRKVGVLESILEKPASNVYVIHGADGKEHLIPDVPVFVRKIDAENGMITVRMIEGM